MMPHRDPTRTREKDMAQLIPHVAFNGNAEEAFNFYKSVLGGELSLMRWKDNPDCQDWSEEEKNQVMHAALSTGDAVLMGNDTPKKLGQTITPGNNFTVTIA